MILIKTDKKIIYYKFSNLCKYGGLKHFVSTRTGGISVIPFDSLNLGLKVDDELSAVIHNRQVLAKAVGISINNFIIPSQCHGNTIQIVSTSDKGRGIYDKADAICKTDALITSENEICLMIFAADCVPVLFFDVKKKVIAAAHAGWKGTVNNIVQDVVKSMTKNFGSEPNNIMAGIGPSIGPCCYTVGEDVIIKVKNKFGENTDVLIYNEHSHKITFDLWNANKINLINAGILKTNIEISDLCTFCNSDKFFSHRKSGGYTGRFGAGIMLE